MTMNTYLNELFLFYKGTGNIGIDIISTISMVIIGIIGPLFLLSSTIRNAKLIQAHYDNDHKKRWLSRRIPCIMLYLITLATTYIFSLPQAFGKVETPLLIELVIIVTYCVSLYCLLLLEAGLATFYHIYMDFQTYGVVLQHAPTKYITAIHIVILVCLTLISIILWNTDNRFAKHLGIKRVADLNFTKEEEKAKTQKQKNQ